MYYIENKEILLIDPKRFNLSPRITIGQLSNNHFVVDFNYWYGYHFIAPRGNPILQSVSEKNENYNRPTRKLLYSEFRFLQPIYNGVDLQIGFRLFYNPLRKEIEYSYSLFLKVEISRLGL